MKTAQLTQALGLLKLAADEAYDYKIDSSDRQSGAWHAYRSAIYNLHDAIEVHAANESDEVTA